MILVVLVGCLLFFGIFVAILAYNVIQLIVYLIVEMFLRPAHTLMKIVIALLAIECCTQQVFGKGFCSTLMKLWPRTRAYITTLFVVIGLVYYGWIRVIKFESMYAKFRWNDTRVGILTTFPTDMIFLLFMQRK